MVTFHQSKLVVAGATSVILIQLISSIFIRPPINLNSSVVLADTPPKAMPKSRYVPPARRPPKSTQATISRGCAESGAFQPVSLTLLVPNDHDGLTTSGHPTFFWYATASIPMTFTLTEPGTVQPLLEQQVRPQAGIVQFKMPQNLPELVSGRDYRWSVTLVCNPERPSANAFIQTWIKRVPTTPELSQQIAATSSERDRSLIYAQAGLWYDALEAISTAHSTYPNDKSLLEERLLLLDQAGLSQVATQERQRLANR